MSTNFSLPDLALLREQAEWLAPARGRLLRQVGVAHRRRILDLGAGYGAMTGELARRGGGRVVALDREVAALRHVTDVVCVAGDACQLPFANQSFDLVFCQCVLLWVGQVATAVHEIQRILQPNGVLIAIEPDYDGLIESPPEIASRDLWLAALARAGAEARIGRLLPGLLAAAGFQVKVNLLDEVTGGTLTRFEFLRTLPLTAGETAVLQQIETTAKNLQGDWQQVAHLPFVLVTAVKR